MGCIIPPFSPRRLSCKRSVLVGRVALALICEERTTVIGWKCKSLSQFHLSQRFRSAIAKMTDAKGWVNPLLSITNPDLISNIYLNPFAPNPHSNYCHPTVCLHLYVRHFAMPGRRCHRHKVLLLCDAHGRNPRGGQGGDDPPQKFLVGGRHSPYPPQ